MKRMLYNIVNGRDVVTCDDGTILKGNDDHVDIYWPSDSEKEHGHGGFDVQYGSHQPYVAVEPLK